MKIVLTGSLGNIGKPLTQELVKEGHSVTVISSNPKNVTRIESLGAKPAIGKMQDAGFLAQTFSGSDIVYLMETMEAVGDMFDKSVDFIGGISAIGLNYKKAIEQAGVKKVIHLSSVGAHMEKGNGILAFHANVEKILRTLPDDVSIKFMRPVGFYTNMMSFIHTIKSQGAIISNYGGDRTEPWVSPKDIAVAIAEEINTPFHGRTVRYIASDEVSPNEIAMALGTAIGIPGLMWNVIPDDQLLKGWLGIGFNEHVAKGFVEMQAAQGDGSLYEDYYKHKPKPGNVKLKDFAVEFATAYKE